MSLLLAIDPGSEKSAYVIYNPVSQSVERFGYLENREMLREMSSTRSEWTELAIEYPQPRGQPLWSQLVDTIVWIGRFVCVCEEMDRQWIPVDRKDVKMHLCGFVTAKDSNIRAALISRFPATGEGKIRAIGSKKKPGPLYGISNDVWSALAVAVTTLEKTPQ